MGERLLSMGVGRRLFFVDDVDRRFLQGAFMVLVALDVGLRAAAGRLEAASFPVAGTILAGLATLLTFAVSWRRLAPSAIMVIPVLDIAALGLLRLTPQVSGAAALILVPVIWLGGQFGRRGALVTLVAGLLLVGLPGLAYYGFSAGTVSRALLLPLVAAWGASTVAILVERMAAGLESAERDRTDLTEALRIIEHQRRFSEAILDTVDVGLVLLDKDGAYQSVNRRHEDFIRLAFPDGHEGRAGQIGLVYHEDGLTPVKQEEMPSFRAAQGEEFDDIRIWVGDDPLTRRALSVSARSVYGVWGDFAGAALAYKDVTDFMRALRVKDQFVASVSHELRTPLTSIMGYVDLLREAADTTTWQRGQLEVVARNTDRLRRLVADLLHSAQVEEGPLHLVRTETDLCDIVRGAVEAAGPVAEAKGIVLVSHLPDSLPVRVDGQRMAQVVDNLLSNAIKYTPAGGTATVAVGLDGDRFELSVSDTGIGIDAVDRERLFTRFFRAHRAEQESVQGVGLGLSITKSIVESHGGRIEVDSEPGRGSTFRVRIPV